MVTASPSIQASKPQSPQAAAEAEGASLDRALDVECERITTGAHPTLTLIRPTRQIVLDTCRTMLTELDAGEPDIGLVDWLRKEIGEVMVQRADECAKFVEKSFPALAGRGLRHTDRAAWDFAVTRFVYSINDNCPECGGRIVGDQFNGRECTDCENQITKPMSAKDIAATRADDAFQSTRDDADQT